MSMYGYSSITAEPWAGRECSYYSQGTVAGDLLLLLGFGCLVSLKLVKCLETHSCRSSGSSVLIMYLSKYLYFQRSIFDMGLLPVRLSPKEIVSYMPKCLIQSIYQNPVQSSIE